MKKSKKIIFVCCFCVLISLMLFVVPCSASVVVNPSGAVLSAITTIESTRDSSDYREYVFNDTVYLGDTYYLFDFYVKSVGVLYDTCELRPSGLVWYNSTNSDRLDPYYITSGWELQDYRTVMIDYSTLEPSAIQFLNENGSFVEVEEPNGIFNDFYSIFVEYVYGDVTLTPEMRLTAVLCSSILSVLVIAFPIIIVFWVSKFILNLMR